MSRVDPSSLGERPASDWLTEALVYYTPGLPLVQRLVIPPWRLLLRYNIRLLKKLRLSFYIEEVSQIIKEIILKPNICTGYDKLSMEAK